MTIIQRSITFVEEYYKWNIIQTRQDWANLYGTDNDIIIKGNGLYEIQFFAWANQGGARTYLHSLNINIFDYPLNPDKPIAISASFLFRNIINQSGLSASVARVNATSNINSTGWLDLQHGQSYSNGSGAIGHEFGTRNVSTARSFAFGNGLFSLKDQPF